MRAFAKEEKACAHTVSSHTKISIQYPVERVVPWSSERRAALALATKPAGALRFITHKLRLKLRAALSHRGFAAVRGARSVRSGGRGGGAPVGLFAFFFSFRHWPLRLRILG